uniref:Cation-transporting ATPase n=1 Tax=Steinernema glaseri TaxID=37863 RepID=A0A1I8AK79_9BILA
MATDSLVEAVVTYQLRPIWAHAYCGPYFILYGIWFYLWTSMGMEENWELGCIVMAGIGVLQVLTVLFCHWFVWIRSLFTCSYIPDATKATLARVTPTPNNGWAEIVPLRRTKLKDGEIKLWFEFQKVHYTYDADKKTFRSFEFDVNRPMKYFQGSKGLETDEVMEDTKLELGDNEMEMVIPQFMELFKERATAPFFVFQVFCVGLWCLEDMWYYSVFTLFMLMTFEATLVKQQLRNMSEIRNMGNRPYMIQCYRNKRWNKVRSCDLLCGDIISIGRSSEDKAVPCDLLLLRGPCIVDESMLTGESVPQMKEPIEEVESDRYFNLESDGRLHVLFGGTKIVQHSPPPKQESGIKAPDNGCICMVIRTGFNTSQGRLLRTIMFGVKRVTANNLETFCFILFLLIFAIAASAYLWIKGSEDPTRSKYKLFLECSLILTSVIPPELPIELSLAVNNSLMALQKLGVFCTEPFRIPFAGKIDVCCFDKTGTLTTDNLVVEGIAGYAKGDDSTELIRSPADLDVQTIQVLATCHSLVKFDEELVGDPLEKASLAWIDWILSRNDTVVPKKAKLGALKIFHRYHFSSAMKRMTVIAGYSPSGLQETRHIVTVKGAPETLRDMYEKLPENYDDTYRKLTRQGARVLALGIKEVGNLSHSEIREKQREDFENGLNFAGFVVISCPLKPDTKAMIKEIVDSSHKVVMITGDNPLTACHVASVLRFTKKGRTILILDEPENDGEEWVWKSADDTVKEPLSTTITKQFTSQYDFCITGAAFKYLMAPERRTLLRRILLNIRVFARMAPKQKEDVINQMKALGKVTLMCGDGTNDVGALKHANVGVALLSHPFDAVKEEERRKKEEERKQLASQVHIRDNEVADASNAVQKRSANIPAGRRGDAPVGARSRPNAPSSAASRRLEELMKEMEEEEKAQVVRLGDASIAAPFTSKYTSIQSICHVIKQGRCTLVTTLQMFKILALNALILAYSQSVLYLDGIKFSDTQATVQGLLLAACFLFISRSRPLKTLSKQKPMPNIFNVYTLLTVTCQFVIHFGCLLYIVQQAHLADPHEGKVDLEAKFSPNLLNSCVYVMAMALQVATFAVNYRGRPFMESLSENRPMLYSVLFSGSAVFLLASGVSPEMTTQFELVELPSEMRNILLSCVTIDLVACYVVDRLLCFIFGDMRA